jgi:hypothetical protein
MNGRFNFKTFKANLGDKEHMKVHITMLHDILLAVPKILEA